MCSYNAEHWKYEYFEDLINKQRDKEKQCETCTEFKCGDCENRFN